MTAAAEHRDEIAWALRLAIDRLRADASWQRYMVANVDMPGMGRDRRLRLAEENDEAVLTLTRLLAEIGEDA